MLFGLDMQFAYVLEIVTFGRWMLMLTLLLATSATLGVSYCVPSEFII